MTKPALPQGYERVDGPSTDGDVRLDWHLENWARYQQNHWHDYGRWYPSRASGGIVSRSSRSFDEMCGAADLACSKAVTAILDGSCTNVERAAVSYYHLGAVFQFPHLGRGVEVAYESARKKIRKGLDLRGIP